ncbi:tetratricopeptide repeat-containing S1 family peptidase [Fischerella sp. PCC 9605]|uniref:tetratricopeptide repeat-containing S1 family peptidase n=1 Tax=Fischerella sp. PCC 9605 TaxID=1173024 RepID=UPI00047D2AD2|nr:serine protease [Fischerella sp. PCC 9605]
MSVAITVSCASDLHNFRVQPPSLSASRIEKVPANTSTLESQAAKVLTAQEVNDIAKNITVLIQGQRQDGADFNGSGIIIARKGNVYYILTAEHVVPQGSDYTIVTPDDKQHISKDIKVLSGIDLAVLEFTSNQNYQIATIADYTPQTGSYIFVSGWPGLDVEDKEESRLFSAGVLFNKDFAFWTSKDPLDKGYEFLYGNITYPGMSGGPVFDISGRVIGVHGNSEGEGELGSEMVLGYGMGIPIRTFLKSMSQVGLTVTPSQAPPPTPTAQQISSIISFLNLKEPKNSKDAREWLKYGIQLWRLGQFPEAVAAYDTATQINPRLEQAWYVRGRVLAGLRKFEQAIASYDKALAIKPDFIDAWRLKGVTLGYIGRHQEAIECFEKALKIQPNYLEYVLHHFHGEALQALKRHSEAINSYTNVLKIQSNAATYSNRGVSYYELGNFQAALDDFNSTLQNNPEIDDQIRAYVNRGHTYVKLKKLQAALDDYTSAIKLYPQLPNPSEIAPEIKIANMYYDRGFVRESLKDFQGAIADYTEVVRINPQDSQAYYNRGNVQATLENLPAAIKDWSQAIEINPEYAEAYNNRGFAHFIRKERSKAIEDYNQAIRINPNFAIAYHNRGNAYKVDNRQLALADFRKAAQLYKEQDNQNGYLEVQKLIIELQQ